MGVVRNLRQVAPDDVGVDIAFRADVHAGLAQRRTAIPARWLYDATGSALSADTPALPESSPTRRQPALLTPPAAPLPPAIGTRRADPAPPLGPPPTAPPPPQ